MSTLRLSDVVVDERRRDRDRPCPGASGSRTPRAACSACTQLAADLRDLRELGRLGAGDRGVDLGDPALHRRRDRRGARRGLIRGQPARDEQRVELLARTRPGRRRLRGLRPGAGAGRASALALGAGCANAGPQRPPGEYKRESRTSWRRDQSTGVPRRPAAQTAGFRVACAAVLSGGLTAGVTKRDSRGHVSSDDRATAVRRSG